ncbi:MAG TPA: threonine-phosphate decarboxylase CobD [Steroidobacteraceae bacterium]
MLEHGGRLLLAVQRYGVPRERWLDLSTGINPIAWQGAPLPMASWNRLPEDEDGLVEAAEAYYEAPRLLPICGSQAAIQALPRLRGRCRVGVPALGYNEHGHRWRQAGHEVVPLAVQDFGAAVDELDVLVVCNPNNPTGERVTVPELLEWHARLSVRGGWLVVDEAFADSTPDTSIARYTDREGLVVLRSLGKFFGLAGARVGFALSEKPLLDTLAEWLGPWGVAGPARIVAGAALSDRVWQEKARQRLRHESRQLAELLTRHGLRPDGGCDLFQWVRTPQALDMHAGLAREGVLTRHFAAVPSLRFGLPGTSEGWQRLEEVLGKMRSRGVVA